MVKLKFKDGLVQQRPPLTAIVLHERLKKLCAELQTIDQQDEANLGGLKAITKTLIDKSLLLHKDRMVKALVALCLAHILRIHAPNAPYSEQQLVDIFHFIFRQIGQIWKVPAGQVQSDTVGYGEYLAILDSLVTVKSVMIITDLPGAEDMASEIIQNFLGGIRADTPAKLSKHCLEITCMLVDGLPSVSMDLIQAILATFLDKAKKNNPAAYNFAVDLCRQSAPRLRRPMSNYFSEILTPALSTDEHEENELDEVKDAHKLITRIFAACPTVLTSTVNLLELELSANDVQLRQFAVECMAKMFCDADTTFAKTSPNAWRAFLHKECDKAHQIRLILVEALGRCLQTHSELAQDICVILGRKLRDVEPAVRLAACKVFSTVDLDTSMRSIPPEIWKAIAVECVDKKQAIRFMAQTTLGRIYQLAYPQIAAQDPQVLKYFAWIPEELINAHKTDDKSIRETVEQVVDTYIIPPPTSTEVDGLTHWTDRMLTVFARLQPATLQQWMESAYTESSQRRPFIVFLKLCKEYAAAPKAKSEALGDILRNVVHHIASWSSNVGQAEDDLLSFAKQNDKLSFQMLDKLMEPLCELKTVLKNRAEVIKRHGSAKPNGQRSILHVMIDRYTPLYCNVSVVPYLLKALEASRTAESTSKAEAALLILSFAAKHMPFIFAPHSEALIVAFYQALALDDQDSNRHKRLCALLTSLSGVARVSSTHVIEDQDAVDRFSQLILADDFEVSQAAVKVMCASKDQSPLYSVVGRLVNQLSLSRDARAILPKLGVFHKVAKYAPDLFLAHNQTIQRFIIERVLEKVDPEAPTSEWIEDDGLDADTLCKIVAIKTLTNHCISQAKQADGLQIADATVNLLFSVCQSNGSLPDGQVFAEGVMARMRLQSILSMLKIARCQEFADLIYQENRFEAIVFKLQDASFEIREKLTQTISRYIVRNVINPDRWLMSLALIAHDPENELKMTVQRTYKKCLSKFNDATTLRCLIYPFTRLIHLLSHHPDFSLEKDDLEVIAAHLVFYLGMIANKDNVALFYYLTSKLKTVADSDRSWAVTNKLYVAAELTNDIIRKLCNLNGWTLDAFRGKAALPVDIFVQIDASQAQRQQQTTYISDTVLQAINVDKMAQSLSEGAVRAKNTRLGRAEPVAFRPAEEAEPSPLIKRVRQVNGVKKEKPKKTRKAKVYESDEMVSDSEDDQDALATKMDVDDEIVEEKENSRPRRQAATEANSKIRSRGTKRRASAMS